MRFPRWMLWVVLVGCGDSGQDGGQAGQSGGDQRADAGLQYGGQGGAQGGQSGQGGSGSGSKSLQVPRIYPIVRAGTPSGLIADSADKNPGDPSFNMVGDDAGTQGPGNSGSLAQIVQDRLYSPGPTEILRIVRELDSRTAGLNTDTNRAAHTCSSSAPIERSWTFPGGQTFRVQLQCLQEWSGGWLAFGFAPAQPDGEDAGAADSGDDFYLVEGQDGGMGGAYRVRAASGNVEAWITVADQRAPSNSQVLMHLLVDAAAMTTELSFGGSGVGFCSAHLKTGADHLFIRGKPNAPPPPGAPMGHYCDTEHSGCFATSDLHNDLGPAADSCKPINSAHFAIPGTLDSSSDPEGNVTPGTIYTFFDTKPQGIAAY